MTLERLFTRAREELLPHMGHRIVIVYYGDKNDPVNIAVECMRCGQVLIDFTQAITTCFEGDWHSGQDRVDCDEDDSVLHGCKGKEIQAT
jgi:hypothetical protein